MKNERLKALGVIHLEKVDSTNIVAKSLANEGAAHGTLVLADLQTQGRGRRGRTWFSCPGHGAFMSLIARDYLPERGGELPLVTAVAVARAIEDVCSFAPEIKWPNDIVMGGKKICGMLLEAGPGFAVIGVGINILGTDFPDDLPHAGSIESTTGTKIERDALVEAFLLRFETHFSAWQKNGLAGLLPEYKKRSCTLGREVRALCPDGEYEGIARDIAPDGALLLALPDGTEKILYAGDVSVRGLFSYV